MDDLKIRQKCEDMLVYGYTAIRQFPKSERHVLAQELRLTMWSVLRLIIIVNRHGQLKFRLTKQFPGVDLDVLGCFKPLKSNCAIYLGERCNLQPAKA